MRATIFASLIVLASCGPVTPVKPNHFFVCVYNSDTLPNNAEITWWFGSQVAGDIKVSMDPGTEYSFDLGENAPDGFQLETTAWSASWGRPDYDDCWVFHVYYPKWQNTYKTYLKH